MGKLGIVVCCCMCILYGSVLMLVMQLLGFYYLCRRSLLLGAGRHCLCRFVRRYASNVSYAKQSDSSKK